MSKKEKNIMENQIDDKEDDELDFDEDDFIDFLHEEQWENSTAYQQMLKKMPVGWHPIKVVNFRSITLTEMRGWLKENCQGKYKEDGFSSGCSYHVAILFEKPIDAIMFKLRWS